MSKPTVGIFGVSNYPGSAVDVRRALMGLQWIPDLITGDHSGPELQVRIIGRELGHEVLVLSRHRTEPDTWIEWLRRAVFDGLRPSQMIFFWCNKATSSRNAMDVYQLARESKRRGIRYEIVRPSGVLS